MRTTWKKRVLVGARNGARLASRERVRTISADNRGLRYVEPYGDGSEQQIRQVPAETSPIYDAAAPNR